jgi:hypothetical protein
MEHFGGASLSGEKSWLLCRIIARILGSRISRSSSISSGVGLGTIVIVRPETLNST